MNVSLNRVFGVIAFAALIGAGCMQGAVQARFHLPVTAHWGDSLLKPGDYTLRVLDLSNGPNQLVVEGEGHKMYEMVQAVDDGSAGKGSSLQLVERNGVYFVEEYRSKVTGRTYTFGVPKLLASRRTKSIELEN